jgi:PIN domain nuclease of toxin-antitoxin system
VAAQVYLLDTHVFLWLLGRPERVPAEIQLVLGDRENTLRVSAASALEIATKVRLGKLTVPAAQVAVGAWIEQLGAEPLGVSVEHAGLAGSMPWPHRDPFDRILVAQALLEGMTLVTVDAVLKALPAPRVLSW